MTKLGFLLLLVISSAHASWVSTYQDFTTPMWDTYVWDNESNVEELPNARSLEELKDYYGNENFYAIYNDASEDFIEKSNYNLNQILNEELEQDLVGNNTRILTSSQTRTVFRAVERERVVRRQHYYDRDEVLGLCFGRAIIAHFHALARGVDRKEIKKIWVLGDMEQWQFHVATILKTTKGWYAIDTYTGLMSLDKWQRRMLKDKKRNAKSLMFFVTDAERFGFLSNHIYSSLLLFNYDHTEIENFVEDYRAKRSEDFYNGFFVDFFRSFDDKHTGIRAF